MNYTDIKIFPIFGKTELTLNETRVANIVAHEKESDNFKQFSEYLESRGYIPEFFFDNELLTLSEQQIKGCFHLYYKIVKSIADKADKADNAANGWFVDESYVEQTKNGYIKIALIKYSGIKNDEFIKTEQTFTKSEEFAKISSLFGKYGLSVSLNTENAKPALWLALTTLVTIMTEDYTGIISSFIKDKDKKEAVIRGGYDNYGNPLDENIMLIITRL
jgi:hypothetical protein